jgi:PEP-CTERM motif
MRRLLPALLFILSVVPTVRADSFTYVATEQFTKQTPTEEDISWAFTGPQAFTVQDILTPAPNTILDPTQKPGEWLYLLIAEERYAPGNAPPLDPSGITFGTWGSFGTVKKRCWPDCPMNDENKFSMTFDTSRPGYAQFAGSTFLGTFPVSGDPPPVSATPEPGSLLLMGSGIIGLISLRKLRRSEKP